MDEVAVGGDEFDGGGGGREVAIVQAGAVRGGGDGSRDRDVRERGEIVEGEAARIDDGGEVAVTNAGADGDRAAGGVKVDGVERVEGDLVLRAIRNGVEGMA